MVYMLRLSNLFMITGILLLLLIFGTLRVNSFDYSNSDEDGYDGQGDLDVDIKETSASSSSRVTKDSNSGSGSGVGDQHSYDELIQFDKDIDLLKASFENGNILETAELWAEIGLMYKELDKNWNDGGKQKALESFDKSLSLTDPEEKELLFAGTMQKALLLMEMGRGLEAVKQFHTAKDILQQMESQYAQNQKLLNEFEFDFDFATIYRYLGDVYLTILKDPKTASDHYYESLLLYPCGYSVYWKYVNALLDISDPNHALDSSKWHHILQFLEKSAEKYVLPQHASQHKRQRQEDDLIDEQEGGDSDSDSDSGSGSVDDDYNKEVNPCAMYESRSFTAKFNLTELDIVNPNNDNNMNMVAMKEKLDKIIEEHQEDKRKSSSAIYWTLSAVANRLNYTDLSWLYLSKAHQMDKYLLDTSRMYSLFQRQQAAESIIERQRSDFWPARQLGIGSSSTVPVFIVGFFRSGSTLLETMLDAHPQIWGMGEESVLSMELPEFKRRLLATTVSSTPQQGSSKTTRRRKTRFDVREGGEVVRDFADRIVKRMVKRYLAAKDIAEKELHFIDDIVEAGAATPDAEEWRNSIDLQKQKQRLSAFQKKILPLSSRSKSSSKGTNETDIEHANFKIVDKMLANYWNIGLIHLLFPNAIILHTVRDPLDTLLSCYCLKFASPLAVWTLDMHTLVEEYVIYLQLMDHFKHQLATHNQDNNKGNPGNTNVIIDISYEALVSQPEPTMRALLYRLGVPWDDGVMDYTATQRTVHTASMIQVRKQIYTSSVGNWQKYSPYLVDSVIPLLQQRLIDAGIVFAPICSASTIALSRSQSNSKQSALEQCVEMNWKLDIHFNYSHQIELFRSITQQPISKHDIQRLLCLDMKDCVQNRSEEIKWLSVSQFLEAMPASSELLQQQGQYLKSSVITYESSKKLLQLFTKVFIFFDSIATTTITTDREEDNSNHVINAFTNVPSLLRVVLLLQRGRLLSRLYRQAEALLDFNEALRVIGYSEYIFSNINTTTITATNELLLPSDVWIRSSYCYQEEFWTHSALSDAETESIAIEADSSQHKKQMQKQQQMIKHCQQLLSKKLVGVAVLVYYRAEALYSIPTTDFEVIMKQYQQQQQKQIENNERDTDNVAFFSPLVYAVKDFREAILLQPFDISIYFSYLQSIKSLYVSVQSQAKQETQKQQQNTVIISQKELQLSIQYALEVVDKFGKEVLRTADNTISSHTIDTANNPIDVVENIARHTAGIYWSVSALAEAINDYQLAWKSLEVAHKLDSNRLQSSSFKYSKESNRNRIQQIIQSQSKQVGFWPPNKFKIGLHSSKLCVFIVGFYRSGSSLLETMLRRHSNVESIGEHSILARQLQVFENKLQSIVRSNKISNNKMDPERAVDELKALVNSIGTKILNKTRSQVIENMRHSYRSSSITIPVNNSNSNSNSNGNSNSNSNSNSEDSDEEPSHDTKKPQHAQITRVLDKMLANYMNIGLIHMLFPNAVIIHTMRDPFDTILSCYKHRFSSDQLAFTLDMHHLIAEYINYLRIMQHFREQLPHQRIIDVSYESIVAAPEPTLRALLYKLGLSWEDRVLDHTTQQRTVYTASMMQVREKLYLSSIGSWRKYAPYLDQSFITEYRDSLVSNNITFQKLPKVGTGYSILSAEAASTSTSKKDKEDYKAPDMNWKADFKFDYEKMILDIINPKIYQKAKP